MSFLSKTIISICLVVSWLGCINKNTAPPNVVFIMVDQWRMQDFGYTGNKQVKTPHIDKLASESINFTHAVASTPVCASTRASIMSGQYPLTHGVFYNDKPFHPNGPVLAEIYKDAGYKTGYVGKWHMNGGPDSLGMMEKRDLPIPKERRLGFDFWKVYECTHNYNDSYYYDENNVKHKWPGYDAIAQTDTVISFIENHADNPFFMFLSYGPPHAPYLTAPEKYQDLYKDIEVELRPNVLDSYSDIAKKNIAGYYAHMTAIDDCIARLQIAIKDQGIEDNTIFVFTSDHGDMLWSHGMTKKQKPWDESIRIPFLIKYPQEFGRSGKHMTVPFGTPDVMPTLLDLSKLNIPTKVEGRSYLNIIKAKETVEEDFAALISCPVPFHQWNFRKGGKEYRGLRTNRYTYARDLNGPWILYDNEVDPYQMNNVLGQEDYAEIQNSLEIELTRQLKETNDQFLPAHDYMRQWSYGWDNQDSMRVEL